MIPILLLFLLVFFGYLYYSHTSNHSENVYETLGYSKEERELIETLEEEKQNILKEIPYHSKNLSFLTIMGSKLENLTRYLSYYEKNKEVNLEEIVALVNANYDEEPYSETLVSLIQEKYFIKENLTRYYAYQEKYPNKTLSDIVKEVNVHLDYEFYTHTMDSDLSKGNLMIANKYYSIGTYVPENLVTLTKCTLGAYQVTEETSLAFYKMCEDMKKEGLSIVAQSTYRSYSTQKALYSRYVNTHGITWADNWSARAGFSEHQTGRTLDIVSPTTDFDTFEYSKEYEWLKENSYRYGFILRYPKGSEYLTGYDFESWHYRYVGIEDATKIKNLGITFDEYYEYFIK